MKRILLLLCALVLLPGCSYILPQSNQPPKAYINEITPSEVVVGETVKFSGYGTDVDGQVVAYRWRSVKDGDLSSAKEFETSSLTVGDHVIYFMVQDNNDAWSAEVRGTVKVSAAATAPAKINSFTASALTITAGDSVTLSWNVSDATTMLIDQGVGTVAPIGSVAVTPATTTTYKLTATGGGSTATAVVTVAVQAPVLDIVFFSAEPEAVPSGETSTLSWKVTGATEVTILPIIGAVDPEGEIDVTVAGEQTYTFTLVATDGDDTMTSDVEVQSYLLMPDHYTVELTADIDASGYVRSTNAPWSRYIYVGDDNNDIGIQGFVTFDISSIPDDAMITSVTIDLSDHETTYGDPFGDLGCLRAYAHNYGTLDGGDYFDGSQTGAIGRWCDQDQIDTLGGLTDGFKDALEDRVGEDTFQFRLQFNQEETDEDGNNDMVRWTAAKPPLLIVEYYSYE
jgi:hypothetical protein